MHLYQVLTRLDEWIIDFHILKKGTEILLSTDKDACRTINLYDSTRQSIESSMTYNNPQSPNEAKIYSMTISNDK
jgi:hypothetical protein